MRLHWLNSFYSLGPDDAILRWRSESTLVQVMFCSWRHQAITWTNVDLSPVRSCGSHLRILSYEDLKIPISKARLKITFVTFENIAWPMTNSSRPFPPVVKEPAVVRLIDCYTMHTTKSDLSGCCYASKKNLYRGPLNHAYLYFLPKFEPTYKVQAVNRRDQTPHGEPPKSRKHHYRYF